MAEIGLLEDNPRIAKLCATMLHYVGHTVTIYKHPDECLQALLPDQAGVDRSCPGPFPTPVTAPILSLPSLPIEVLILDLYMPDIAGVDVLQRLRSHPRTQHLPLILCTAATRSEIARALHIAPQATVVEKPFKLQELTSAINSLLSSLNHEVKDPS